MITLTPERLESIITRAYANGYVVGRREATQEVEFKKLKDLMAYMGIKSYKTARRYMAERKIIKTNTGYKKRSTANAPS